VALISHVSEHKPIKSLRSLKLCCKHLLWEPHQKTVTNGKQNIYPRQETMHVWVLAGCFTPGSSVHLFPHRLLSHFNTILQS